MLKDADLQQLINCCEQIIGKQYVSVSIFEKIKNAIDPFPYSADRENLPYVVVMPQSGQQISEVLKYANEKKIPVFIRGSGTQLAGSSRPHTSGIVINTRLMNDMEIFSDRGYFEAGPGVRCKVLADYLAQSGYFLPILPGSVVIASLGGLLSNNTSGHIIDPALGKLADYVLGVEAVLPTGEIIETGTTGLRKPAGTDLTKLFVGGDGLMGVITKVRMRLLPLPEKAYGLAILKDLASIARGVKRMYLEKCPPPLFMEFMDIETAKVAYNAKGLEAPPGNVIMFMGIGQNKEEATRKMGLVMECFKKEDPIEARQITDVQEWAKIWSAREVIAPYLMNSTQGKIVVAELVSNLSQLEECMEDGFNFNVGVPILEDLKNYFFGHIGALTMHPTFFIPSDWDDEKGKRAVQECFKKETEINLKYRTSPGEWGQFSKRKDFFVKRYGEDSYAVVKKIKAALDPNNILNTGILEGYR